VQVEGDIRIPEGVGLVVVGRNEAPRLAAGLARIPDPAAALYVDSGSTDGSPEVARRHGFEVLELDSARPFTAARARNEGLAVLRRRRPELRAVHFCDGDCLLDPRWLPAGLAELDAVPEVGLVSGVLREQDAQASVFNRLLDMEWQQPVGDDTRIGGNAMARLEAFDAVGGFREDLPAGEEGELHARLRAAGWIVRRIDVPMAYHDAAMTALSQWWQRNVRAGQATAEGVELSGADDPGLRRLMKSNFLWGLAVPAAGALGAPVVPIAGYAALYAKILRAELLRGRPLADAELYARFTVLSKMPQAYGQLRYRWLRARGRRTRVIDWREGV